MMLDKLLKHVHKDWLPIFNEPTDGKVTLMDLLEKAVQEVIATGSKSCPDSPDKILRALSVAPDKVKVIIMGQD